MNLGNACPHCSAAAYSTPIDGGGVVVSYACTAEYVVARKGEQPRQVKACPDEPRHEAAIRAIRRPDKIVAAEKQILNAIGDKK